MHLKNNIAAPRRLPGCLRSHHATPNCKGGDEQKKLLLLKLTPIQILTADSAKR